MNAVLQAMKERRSVRAYQDKPVPRDAIERICEAGTYAPTGMGLQSPIILAVTNRQLRDRLSAMNARIMGRDADPFYGAPVVLVVCYDEYAAWVRTGIDEKNHGEIDAAIATTQIMLQAADLGLGTTYVGVFDPERLRQELPELAGRTPIALLPVGYPAEGAHPNKLHTQRKPLEEFYTEL